jgi:hypothetical protein
LHEHLFGDIIGRVFLAGIHVSDRLVLEFARRLRAAELDVTAAKLERAWSNETRILALELEDRESLLRVMEDWCPPELGDLRATLVQEHVSRRAQGL